MKSVNLDRRLSRKCKRTNDFKLEIPSSLRNRFSAQYKVFKLIISSIPFNVFNRLPRNSSVCKFGSCSELRFVSVSDFSEAIALSITKSE